jgi:hypothetical protein
MTRHDLKCWPEYFRPVWMGVKRFEIRRNDRDYRVGDELLLREWEPGDEKYSGRELLMRVVYLTDFEQQPGFIVMGIDR